MIAGMQSILQKFSRNWDGNHQSHLMRGSDPQSAGTLDHQNWIEHVVSEEYMKFYDKNYQS